MKSASLLIGGSSVAAMLTLVSCQSPVERGLDRVEDRIDRAENRYDRRHWSGPGDRVEDRWDRREDRWDRRGF